MLSPKKEIVAIDNYLQGAEVTLTCDTTPVTTHKATTGSNGKALFDAAIDTDLCTTVVEGGDDTFDIDEPNIAWKGTLKAPKGKKVANAFTTLYVLYQEAGVADAEIAALIVADLDPNGTLGLTPDNLFSDFGSNAGDAKSSKLLKLSNATYHAMASVVAQRPAELVLFLAALKNTAKQVGKIVTEQVNIAENNGVDLDKVKIVVTVKVNSDGSVVASGKTEDLGTVAPTPTPPATGTGTGTEGGGGTGA